MGLRQGEALGLRWHDVDFAAGSLRIQKQLQRLHGQFELVDVKTARSRRTLAMPASVAAELEQHCRRQAEELKGRGAQANSMSLVFTRPDGGPLDGTVVTHQFHRLLDQAGLPQRRFHDLRHSCATLLLGARRIAKSCDGDPRPLADRPDYEYLYSRASRAQEGSGEEDGFTDPG